MQDRSDERFRALFSELFDLFDRKANEVQRLRGKTEELENMLKIEKSMSNKYSFLYTYFRHSGRTARRLKIRSIIFYPLIFILLFRTFHSHILLARHQLILLKSRCQRTKHRLPRLKRKSRYFLNKTPAKLMN
jgi:hypothetical protein